jgi:colicin import membrane protein
MAFFDEGDGDGGGGATDGGGTSGGGAAAASPAATTTRAVATDVPATPPASRESGQKYASIADAERRIGELAESDKSRRLENKELKGKLSETQRQIELTNQRAIRAEARVALVEEGAIDTDVVDLLLKAAGDSIKIDDKTGDIVGVREAIADYKVKKPSFFKAVQAIVDDKSKTDDEKKAETESAEKKAAEEKAAAEKKAADDAAAGKQNSTASGASTSGAGGGTGTTFGGLPDLRNLTSAERKAAMADYKRSIKGRR